MSRSAGALIAASVVFCSFWGVALRYQKPDVAWGRHYSHFAHLGLVQHALAARAAFFPRYRISFCLFHSSLFRRRSALGKAFEPSEGVVDKHPILEHFPFRLWVGGCKMDTGEGTVRLFRMIACGKKGKCHLRISSATSGNSSKFDVSSIERTSTGMAAGRSRMCSQSTPRKNCTSFRSSIPRCEPSL